MSEISNYSLIHFREPKFLNWIYFYVLMVRVDNGKAGGLIYFRELRLVPLLIRESSVIGIRRNLRNRQYCDSGKFDFEVPTMRSKGVLYCFGSDKNLIGKIHYSDNQDFVIQFARVLQAVYVRILFVGILSRGVAL